MKLIVAYVLTLLVAQAISISAGLLVDRLHSSYAGLMVFIALYFFMFWLSWQIAVRVTAPKGEAQKA
jgi:hypothetical protein